LHSLVSALLEDAGQMGERFRCNQGPGGVMSGSTWLIDG
jgi:hypothetical protein